MKRMLLLALLAATLAAACTRLTAENYAKLRIGMSFDEVQAILGAPDRCSDVLGAKGCIWGDETRNIKVNFIGDRTVLFTAENLR
ncbi:MAG TPA: hypothetical protein VNK91_05470 [Burkholderiaceae bacterium]|jgi:hypothetical protein|nr:hypothetical protein [Burkholderiaceae bacterium]